MRLISFADAILEAQHIALETYGNCLVMGLGVPDPKGVFGSTLGLQKKFGKEKVFDIPLSENALTGVAIGAAATGMRPIMTHQRLDFALVSVEQIVNQAAKWNFMFNEKMCLPLVIRMIIGRGWGQGPQHSQALHSWFAHIPGLKVVMPMTAYDAKGLLLSSIKDNNPVIFLEHRWLYNIKDNVPPEEYHVPIGKGKVVRQGRDVTIVSISYALLECMKAGDILKTYGVDAEVIDLRSLRPLDKNLILESVKKTGNLVVVDHAELRFGMTGEIISTVVEECMQVLQRKPLRIAIKAYPTPTSYALAKDYYPNDESIVNKVLKLFEIPQTFTKKVEKNDFRDQPDKSFTGPF